VQYDLSELARRARNVRRPSITMRDIVPPATLATNLYQAAYSPLIAMWRRYAERITAEYERSLAALTTDAPADINATLAAAEAELQRLLLTLTPALRQWVLSVENWQRDKWRGAVLAATGVDLGTLIGPADVQQTLEQILEWNTNLVVDVSQQTRQRISNAVFAGLTNRTSAREVAKQISEATGMARERSLRIASDQLTKLTSGLAEERQRQAGITQVEWRSSHKLHARPWHAARDGVVYDLDTHTPIDGGDAVPAGDWVGQAPYCGCRSVARLTFE
jgi:uncharacterized protein with gpF-like domain